MKFRNILGIMSVVLIILSCSSASISKKDREMLETEAFSVLDEAIQDSDYFVRSRAIDAMRDIADPSFVPALIDALYDPDDIVVMKAARALGTIGDTTAIPDLEFTLAVDPNFTAQKASAVALYRLGMKEEALEFIRAGLADESGYNRDIMLNELTFARSDDFIPMYIDMLNDSVGSVRDDAINAISLRNAKQAVPHLMEALTDPYLLIRLHAIVAISKLGDEAQLREALDITQQEIEKMENGDLDNVIEFNEYQLDAYKLLLASTLLLELQDTTYLNFLYDLPVDLTSPTSLAATFFLASWGDENSIQKLSEFSDYWEVDIRSSVVELVSEIDEEWAWQLILKATQDPDDEVRETATRFLQFYDEKEVKEALINLLNDPNPDIKIEAALSLNELGDKNGIYALQPLLLDEDWYVKIDAAKVILLILQNK